MHDPFSWIQLCSRRSLSSFYELLRRKPWENGWVCYHLLYQSWILQPNWYCISWEFRCASGYPGIYFLLWLLSQSIALVSRIRKQWCNTFEIVNRELLIHVQLEAGCQYLWRELTTMRIGILHSALLLKKQIKGVKDQSEAVGIIIIRNNSKIIHASWRCIDYYAKHAKVKFKTGNVRSLVLKYSVFSY